MKIFISIFLLLIASIYSFNTYIDASGQQSAEDVYKLAANQRIDQVLVWDRLFDQRIWIKSKIEAQKANECPSLFIFSSSTLGGIGSTLFPDQRMLNGWMGAPTIEDFEALAQIISQSPCTNMELWLGMDSWFFNIHAKSDRWTSILSDFYTYQLAHGKISLVAEGYLVYWNRFKDRLSFVTTRESFYYFLRHRKNVETIDKPRLVQAGKAIDDLCSSTSSDLYLRSYDGHFFSCPRSALSQKEIEHLAESYLERNAHNIRDWDHVDPQIVRRLDIALKSIRMKVSNLVLIAPPYHPITYASLYQNKRTQMLFYQLDTTLNDLAIANNGIYINLRDPAVSKCTNQEFEDSHHSSKGCLAKITKEIKSKKKLSEER